MKKLGSLTLTVFRLENGELTVEHETELEPGLQEMLGALSGSEKKQAQAIRREACAKTAEFMTFIENPDVPISVGGV